MSKVIRIPARKTPRLPPIEDINNADRILRAVLSGIFITALIGAIVWLFRVH